MDKKINDELFEKLLGLNLDTSSERGKAISFLREKYKLTKDEADLYFEILVEENLLKPELEE